MKDVGLVLEGGGMKGLYTAGVLEYFMENNLYFPYVIGVSAGACMAASYLSRQKGRNKKVNIDLVSDPRFISFRNYIKKRELFGMDFLFDEIPNNLVPFDFETFLNGKEQFVVGTTECKLGKAIYYNKRENRREMLKLLRASSSLPFVAPSVRHNENFLMDGGIIDPIPVKKAQHDGFQKNVIVMTKPENFKMQPSRVMSLMKWMYRKHPKVTTLLQERYRTYNDTLAYIEAGRDKGHFFVIQPSANIRVSRVERDQNKLTRLYELGYEDAKSRYHGLQTFLTSFRDRG
jgi:predicted patatin/cPLA2 family phospholipase